MYRIPGIAQNCTFGTGAHALLARPTLGWNDANRCNVSYFGTGAGLVRPPIRLCLCPTTAQPGAKQGTSTTCCYLKPCIAQAMSLNCGIAKGSWGNCIVSVSSCRVHVQNWSRLTRHPNINKMARRHSLCTYAL